MVEYRFRELVESGCLLVNDGYRAKNDELRGGGPAFLRAGALHDDGFRWEGLDFFTASVNVESKRGYPGDVVITTKGNSVGRVGWVPRSAPDFVYSPHLSFWRSLDQDRIEPRYLYYWSRSDAFTAQLRGLAFATDMAPYFSLRDQLDLRIDLPDAAEQRRIAEVLGAFDDLIETNRQQIDRLIRSALSLHSQFNAPQELRTFGDVANVGGGGTPSTKVDHYWGGSLSWATPSDITALPSPFLFRTSRTITPVGLASCASSLYPPGAILMTSRATIGAFAVAATPTAVNQGFIVVTPRADFDRSYLLLEMMSRVPDFIQHANGSTFLELSRGKFKGLPVDWPPDEYRRRFHARVAPLLENAAELQREIDELTGTRDELLPLLMSGRVRVHKKAA